MRYELYIHGLVALLAAATYANSVFGLHELVFDDVPALRWALRHSSLHSFCTPLILLCGSRRENNDVHGPGGLLRSASLYHDYWGEAMNSSTSHKSYRPMTVLSFRADCIVAREVGRLTGGCSTEAHPRATP